MYTLKVSHGYVDESKTETAEIIGSYETLDEAAKAAEGKFFAILEDLRNPEICIGEVEGSLYEYYISYGDYDAELGRSFAGYNTYYYMVSVIER